MIQLPVVNRFLPVYQIEASLIYTLDVISAVNAQLQIDAKYQLRVCHLCLHVHVHVHVYLYSESPSVP